MACARACVCVWCMWCVCEKEVGGDSEALVGRRPQGGGWMGCGVGWVGERVGEGMLLRFHGRRCVLF